MTATQEHLLTAAIARVESEEYPQAPFHPPEIFEELRGILADKVNENNRVYSAVRQTLLDLRMDVDNAGTPYWNPFSDIVKKGDSVVIKPNLVFHKHILPHGLASMVTHASVIRPIVDYVWKALQGEGQIIIADVPLQSAKWEILVRESGYTDLLAYAKLRGIRIELLDLRKEIAETDQNGIIINTHIHNGDPKGYISVDLADQSLLQGVITHHKKFSITDYPSHTVSKHHNHQKNEYLIPKTVLDADVFINVPKLKTHKKAGVTLSMKNLIGINGDKSWIAHHREGGISGGGDEYPRISAWNNVKYKTFVILKQSKFGVALLKLLLPVVYAAASIQRRIFPKIKSTVANLSTITEGSWYGNDTLWRVILDLNRILLYADANGVMQGNICRKYFTIIDGIWAGERNGPMHHIPKLAGVIVAGNNPVCVDLVASHLMGFDYRNIPQILRAFDSFAYPIVNVSMENMQVVDSKITKTFSDWAKQSTFAFLPPTSWMGHLEHSGRDMAQQTTVIPEILETVGGE